MENDSTVFGGFLLGTGEGGGSGSDLDRFPVFPGGLDAVRRIGVGKLDGTGGKVRGRPTCPTASGPLAGCGRPRLTVTKVANPFRAAGPLQASYSSMSLAISSSVRGFLAGVWNGRLQSSSVSRSEVRSVSASSAAW